MSESCNCSRCLLITAPHSPQQIRTRPLLCDESREAADAVGGRSRHGMEPDRTTTIRVSVVGSAGLLCPPRPATDIRDPKRSLPQSSDSGDRIDHLIRPARSGTGDIVHSFARLQRRLSAVSRTSSHDPRLGRNLIDITTPISTSPQCEPVFSERFFARAAGSKVVRLEGLADGSILANSATMRPLRHCHMGET